MSDVPASGEHPSGEREPGEHDPFEAAAGRLGAAPPPSWGQPPTPAAGPGREFPPPPGLGSPPLGPSPAALGPPAPFGSPTSAGTPAPAGTPRNAGAPAAPWYAEPPAFYGPATRGPYGGAQANYGYSRGFRGRGRFRVRKPPSPTTNVGWLIVSVVTLGLLFPVPAIINWVRAVRYRAPSIARPPALAWFIWAIVFSVLSVGTFAGYAILGATDNTHTSATETPAYVPPTTTTVAVGTAVHLVAEVGEPKGVVPVPVTITLGDPVHQAHSTVRDVNLTVPLRVCATTAKVDPLSVAVGIDLVATGGRDVIPSFDWQLPDAFYAPLEPQHCASGSLGFEVPAGARVRSFTYDGLAGKNVVWTVSGA